MQNLVPAFHQLSVFGHDLQDAPIEVGLQRVEIGQLVSLHESFDRGALRPLALFRYFVAADVEIGVGEQTRHLADESVEKCVGGFARRIHGRDENAGLAYDLVGSFAAGEIRIPGEPTSRVAGHIKLRNHAHAAIARIGDHVADLRLRVIQTVGAFLVEARKFLALDAESLVVRKVPVKYVHLHGGEPVNAALDGRDRQEMTRDVQRQSAPPEARLIGDIDRRRSESIGAQSNQLQQSFEAAQRPQRLAGRKSHILRRDD